MYELKGKRVLVVGLGRSGVAATRFICARGARVMVTDALSEDELRPSLDELSGVEADKKLGGHNDELFVNADLVVASPGVPTSLSGFVKAREKGIPVIGEMELALSEISSPVIAVTGTNGKTTTTALIGHLMDSCGISNCVGGNIGTPAIELIDKANASKWTVFEVSSFQLETTPSLRPKIAVWLNATPDHLDRHRSFEAYVAAKARMFTPLTKESWGVYNIGDEVVRDAVRCSKARLIHFDPFQVRAGGGWFDGNDLWVELNEKSYRFSLRRVRIEGAHNRENMLAAIISVLIAGGNSIDIQAGLEGFKGLPHRLEFVAEVEGVRFYNDSKGTNIGATTRALDSFDRPIVLIAGGQAKGTKFGELVPRIEQKVKKLILMGEATECMYREMGNAASTVKVSSMKEAVGEAWRCAESGDAVLLSPACASFDMFKNYADRGDAFRGEVMLIAEINEGVRWKR